jgi:hypothetical protein
MVKSLNLRRDDPPRIPPPAPCVSYSGEDWGASIHLVCFGERISDGAGDARCSIICCKGSGSAHV